MQVPPTRTICQFSCKNCQKSCTISYDLVRFRTILYDLQRSGTIVYGSLENVADLTKSYKKRTYVFVGSCTFSHDRTRSYEIVPDLCKTYKILRKRTRSYENVQDLTKTYKILRNRTKYLESRASSCKIVHDLQASHVRFLRFRKILYDLPYDVRCG